MFNCIKNDNTIITNNSNFNILIVEDSRVINTSLTKRFEEKGFTCYQSFNLTDAKEILKNSEISLVILDLHLPDGNGEDLIWDIQEANDKTKIIIFTSDNDLSRRDELFRLGILDYVLKGKNANLIVQNILEIIHSIRINPNYTVLIVDDSRVIRSMISKILRSDGYKLLEATSGPEALEVLASNQVDLILLDMEMANMGGMEVLKNIKKEEQNFYLPVLIISSTSDIETMRNVYKEGALDYFKKPFSPEELKLKVERTIKQKQSESDLQCNIETTDLCNHFMSSFYANAVFYANSKLKYADDKFIEYFGENTKNIIQAFKTFDQELIRDIIISMQNSKIFKKRIVDKNNLQYLFKLFPLKNNEFLISIEKLDIT